MKFDYANITVVIQNEQREASVAAHNQPGVAIADSDSEIYLTNSEALAVMHWLQQQESILQFMADVETKARKEPPHSQQASGSAEQTATSRHPSQAEGDLALTEQALGERPATTSQRSPAAPGKPSQAEGDLETTEKNLRRKRAKR